MELEPRLQSGALAYHCRIEPEFRDPHFAEQVQVGRHYYPGTEVRGRREGDLIGKVIRHQANGHLALTVGLLIDRRRDDVSLKIRRHLGEKIGRD